MPLEIFVCLIVIINETGTGQVISVVSPLVHIKCSIFVFILERYDIFQDEIPDTVILVPRNLIAELIKDGTEQLYEHSDIDKFVHYNQTKRTT